MRDLHEVQKKSQREIARELGVSGPTVRKWMRAVGLKPRSISEAKKGKPANPASVEASVKARRKHVLPGRPAVGYKVNGDGYVLLYRPGHPMADGQGYVKEHRLVLAEKLRRLLLPHEDGHHKNHVRTDNRPENLELKDSRADHQREHSKERGRLSDGSFAPAGQGKAKVGTAPCSVDGCGRSSRRRGLCAGHSDWSYRNGGKIPTHLLGQGRHHPRPGRRKRSA